MAGFNELVQRLAVRYPQDWWIAGMRDWGDDLSATFPQVQVYEDAIRLLDDESWNVLAEKAEEAFKLPKTKRGKSQLFNLLNEALAYQYLSEIGKSQVTLIAAEKGRKTPDISFESAGQRSYCEVKTIGVSEEEIDRAESGEVFDGAVYVELSAGFLKKLKDAVRAAGTQIFSAGSHGLVYLVVNFDDFTLMYYEKYKSQIAEVLHSEFPFSTVVVRVGIHNQRHITHGLL